MTIQINTLWPTFTAEIVWEEHQTYQEGLKELIYEDSAQCGGEVTSGVAERIKKNLAEPPLNTFTKYLQDERIRPLLRFIDEQVRSVYLSLSEKYSNRVYPKDISVYFRDSWYHVTKDRGYHDMHYHGNSSFCGIYYLDIGESNIETANGVNRFLSPYIPNTDDNDFGYVWWPREFLDVKPENGKLVIFPGHLYHNATPYSGEKDRLIFAFNSQIHSKENGTIDQTMANLFRHLPISLEEYRDTSI
jgi:hypothetical protein